MLKKLFIIFFIISIIPSCSYSTLTKEKVIPYPEIDVQSVYRRLDNAGFEPGLYDENDFTQLSEAIRRFQEVAKINVDGVLGEDTWSKLKRLYDPLQSGTTSSNREPDLRVSAQPFVPSSSGSQWPVGIVRMLQKLLIEQGYKIENPEGIMDVSSQNAVRMFQKDNDLSVNGNLDSPTILNVIKKSCEKGCEFSIRLMPSEIASLSELSSSELKVFSGTIVEKIYNYAFQGILNENDYDTGIQDGVIDSQVHKAIQQYQKEHHLEENGNLNKKTAESLFSEYCKNGCEFVISMKFRKAERVISDPAKMKKIDPKADYLSCPVNVNDRVFVIENHECSAISGDWILFYEGVVTSENGDTFSVHLSRRYGYRYHPDKEGIDTKDWWCIPKKRHCYSEVGFKDWQGKYAENQVVSFPKIQVYNATIGIINGISEFLTDNCNR